MTEALVLLTVSVVTVIALLAAAGAGTLARIDGATYPTAVTRAATAFTTIIALATAAATALGAFLN